MCTCVHACQCVCLPISVLLCLYSLCVCVRACVLVSVLLCLYPLFVCACQRAIMSILIVCARAHTCQCVVLSIPIVCVCACMHTLFFLSHYVPCVEASTAFQCIMLHVERNTYVCIYFVHIATTILCVYIMVGIGVFYELLFKLLHSLCFHVHMLICVC